MEKHEQDTLKAIHEVLSEVAEEEQILKFEDLRQSQIDDLLKVIQGQ